MSRILRKRSSRERNSSAPPETSQASRWSEAAVAARRGGLQPPDSVDTIGGGDDRPYRPRFHGTGKRWLGSAIAVVVVLAVAGSWADRLERGHEFEELSDTIAASQQNVSFAVSQVVSTRDYTMPLLVTSSSATVRAGLAKLIDQAAAQRVVDLEATKRRVDGVAIVPWHHADRQARAEYVAYLNSRIAAMQSMAAGNGQPSGQGDVFTALQNKAAASLDAAAHTGAEAGRAATLFASPPP
jgi:hypothetical protein